MPYIEQQFRDDIKANVSNVFTPGDLNFLIFSFLVKTFKEHMRYDTIHCFKRDFVVDKKHNKLLNDLRTRYADRFTVGDVYAASEAAYDEFMRRIGSKYEDKKVALNGDVEGLAEILAEIDKLEKPVEVAQ